MFLQATLLQGTSRLWQQLLADQAAAADIGNANALALELLQPVPLEGQECIMQQHPALQQLLGSGAVSAGHIADCICRMPAAWRHLALQACNAAAEGGFCFDASALSPADGIFALEVHASKPGGQQHYYATASHATGAASAAAPAARTLKYI